MNTLLTIAGFDPSSGAGVTADLAVFAAHGWFGCSAVTALTVQSTMGVRRSEMVDPVLLAETLACLVDDLPPAGIKIGMLGTGDAVEVIAGFLQRVRRGSATPVVLDPVLRSSSGTALLTGDGLARLQDQLLPLVDWVTPNRAELSELAGGDTGEGQATEEAAAALLRRYPGLSVVVTGGDAEKPDDLLMEAGGAVRWLRGEKIVSSATHGTGCAFSSALLCGLAAEMSCEHAAAAAKRYVEEAIRQAPVLGRGKGPMNLLWPLRQG